MRWCEWKKENQSDRNQTAETTKALRFTHGHFIQGKHPCAQAHTFSDTLSLIIIPPIFPYHSITINSSPSSYNLFFSLRLLSPFHYDLFTTSPLAPPPFSPSHLVMICLFSLRIPVLPSATHHLVHFFSLHLEFLFLHSSRCSFFPSSVNPSHSSLQQVRWRSWKLSG